MIQKSADKLIEGLIYQAHSGDNYWPKYKERKDKNWFYEGRKIARKLVKMGLGDCLNELEVRREQKKLRETYRMVHRAATMVMEDGRVRVVESEPEMEPCVDCVFILFCKRNGMVCQYYRSWCRGRVPKVEKMWPDKTLEQWQEEDIDDDLI